MAGAQRSNGFSSMLVESTVHLSAGEGAMDGSRQSVAGDLGSSESMQTTAVTHQRESSLAGHMCEAQGTGLVERRSGCGEAFKELALLLPNRQLEGLVQAEHPARRQDERCLLLLHLPF